MESSIEVMPKGYYLQAYDECGSRETQPNVQQDDFHVFSRENVIGLLDERTVVKDREAIRVSYEGIAPNLDYVLAVTYACERGVHREQSLWAKSTMIHDVHIIQAGRVERLLIRVPQSAVIGGKLILEFRTETKHEAVLSSLELWAPIPSPNALFFLQIESLYADLKGQVVDLRYRKVPGADVTLCDADGTVLSTSKTEKDGYFSFAREVIDGAAQKGDITLHAAAIGKAGKKTIDKGDVLYSPIHFNPLPERVSGLEESQISLDGIWRVDPAPAVDNQSVDLTDARWRDFTVPGQLKQQGFDVADDDTVAICREFSVPSEWRESRIYIRFNAIHGATEYRLNGRSIGTSERLYTPVEFDITDYLNDGTNRLDLSMKLQSISEKLSYSSGYAFHSLLGIDRSVILYALPVSHIDGMHISTDLDSEYRDGTVSIRASAELSGNPRQIDMEFTVATIEGTTVASATAPVARRGEVGEASCVLDVPNPLKWSAEEPNLYRLTVDLLVDTVCLERIVRDIGFTKIEIRGSEFLFNGKHVKFAGACHHEIDPLEGRANTDGHAEEDIRLLKGANLNYLRTSHYPPTQELLDTADRLGVYVECEAPLCWVRDNERDVPLREVLDPTAAMIDFCHWHPSIVLWSLANESHYKQFFKVSNILCKDLDPKRPTTFNDPDPERISDIANLHYPPMPYDAHLRGDPRPIFLGEYFYPLCHEQTDMWINPGLREVWGHGHADPDSEWAKFCAKSFDGSFMHPGTSPGAWNHIMRSDRVFGGAIWALIDEPFYLPKDGKAGYAWVHGYWGLIDAWRRPKPEWWLSKLIFSPVWFPERKVSFAIGQSSVRIPVENRHFFTDLNAYTCRYEVTGTEGVVPMEGPPSSFSVIEVPLPGDVERGDRLILSIFDRNNELINVAGILLGKASPVVLPELSGSTPAWTDDGKVIRVETAGSVLQLDKMTALIPESENAPPLPLLEFPVFHLTRIDLADLVYPRAEPYAVFPDQTTRSIDQVTLEERHGGLAITIQDRYEGFAGRITWLIDGSGLGRISYDYTCTGGLLRAREMGIRLTLRPEFDRLTWRRWSEWDVYPDDQIGRASGTAVARRDVAHGEGKEYQRPTWPWSLDQTDLGTNDFRGVKFNIHEAGLSADGLGAVRAYAKGDAHCRSCIDPMTNNILMHLLSECRLGQIVVKPGDRLAGEFTVQLEAFRR